MAEVKDLKQSSLYVFTSRLSSGNTEKLLEIFTKGADGQLKKIHTHNVPKDIVAYDVCQDPKDPAREEMLLLGAKGVYRIPGESPLIQRETLFAHSRDDTIVRVKMCFQVFSGEPRSLLVPRLQGVDLLRYSPTGEYKHYAHFPVRAEARYQWPVLRGTQYSIQRVAVRLEFPDITVVDFNGDQLADVCFTSAELVRCVFQDKAKGFLTGQRPIEYRVQVLNSMEKKDTSRRVESRLVDITGDKKPELVISKSNWNLSDIGVNLYFFHQHPLELFQSKPFQTIERKGYFGFQEYRDHNGDGLLDITAPVASTSWTDIAGAYLTRKIQLDFVLYKNIGGKFEINSEHLHSMNYPIDFKNWTSLLGSLPIWGVAMGQKDPGVLFFPMARTIELRTVNRESGLSERILWEQNSDVGGDIQLLDLDKDLKNELVIAYPRDPSKAHMIKFFDTPRLNLN